MTKLIFGCGYLGSRVAKRWHEAGEKVYVVTRDADRARDFAASGYLPIVADVLRAPTLSDLPVADSVLYAVGHDRTSSVTMHDAYALGLQNALDALSPETGKIIYVSSSGVYAQADGKLVDELSACEPQREGGKATLAAERHLAQHVLGRRAIVLRMAGLYGPGRVPNAAPLMRGEPLAVPQWGYLNLIHVDDAASVVLAADQRGRPPRLYVVSDGHPVERPRYYEEVARLLGVGAVRFAPPAPESAVTARAASSKRLSNARMTSELAVALAYPTYREGLSAILKAET
jgi:nucleoside-diphosphate-sugar epimerase